MKEVNEEHEDLNSCKARLNEMVKEQEKVKKNLRGIISSREKELAAKNKTIEQWGDDKTKAVNEAKLLKAANLKLKDELDVVRAKCKELEGLTTKLRKNLEKNDVTRELTKKEAVIATQEKEIDELKAEKSSMERQVKAHESFVSKEFGGEDHLDRIKLTETIEQMKVVLEQRENKILQLTDTIEQLQQEISDGEGPKLKEKKDEVNKLKAELCILEESNKEKENDARISQEKSRILQKELELDRNIRAVKKTREESQQVESKDKAMRSQSEAVKESNLSKEDEIGQEYYCPNLFLEQDGVCKDGNCQKNHNETPNKIKRGVCVYEFNKKGGCSRKDCWFSHKFPRTAMVAHESFKKQMDEKMAKMKENNRNTKRDNKDGKNIGTICVYEYLRKGSCKFHENCHFDHDFEDSLRTNHQMKKDMEQKQIELKEKRKSKGYKPRQQGEKPSGKVVMGADVDIKDTIGKAVDDFLYSLRALIQKQNQSPKDHLKSQMNTNNRRK